MIRKKLIFPIEFDHIEGGMIQSVISLIRHLSLFHDVYIIAHKDSDILKLNLNVNHLLLQNFFTIDLYSPILSFTTYNEVKALLRDFDRVNTIVFTNNVGSELIFSGFGIFPIDLQRVFISRGGNYMGKTGLFLRLGFKSVSKFICTSTNQKNILKKIVGETKKIDVIHNGVTIFKTTDGKESNFNELIELSIVGYINPNKNQILAVKALKILVDKGINIRLNIYGSAYSNGDKVYKKELLEVISNLKMKDYVFFNGFVSDQTQIYKNTDILLSCSLSEGFGRTVVEAMAYGIPCIGLSQSGGLLDIITDGIDGFLIDNCELELSDKIILLYGDNNLVNLISEQAQKTYKSKFTEEIMCANYLRYIEQNF